MAMERKEKLLVEEKAIVQTEELRPLTMQEVKWKPGRDGRKRKVLVTRVLKEAKGRVFEKMLGQRLRKLNVGVLCAPMGMQRQRENNTTFNRRTGRINWQVEWMTFDDQEAESEEEGTKTKRVLSKVMDDVPLYRAYHELLDEQRRGKGQQSRRPKAQEDQIAWNSTWSTSTCPLQDPQTGQWSSHQGGSINEWPSEKDDAQRRNFQFFLARPRTRIDLPTTLTKLEPTDCFRDILTNTQILEFPTVYVLTQAETLPEGFVLGRKDTVSAAQGMKRKNPPTKKLPGKGKKRRHGGKDLEEGEVKSDEEGGNSDDDGNVGAVGLEAGDVIAEHSLGEEDDGDSDDDTSSSGSDSE